MFLVDRHVSGRDGDGGPDSMSLGPGVENPPTEPPTEGAPGVDGGADPASLTSAAEMTSTQPAVGVDGSAAVEAPLPAAPLPTAQPKKEPLGSLAPVPPTTGAAFSASMRSPVATPKSGAPAICAADVAAAGDVSSRPASVAGEPTASNVRVKLPPASSRDRLRRVAAAVAPAASSWRARRAAGIRCVRRRTPVITGEAPEIAPLVRATWRAAASPAFGDVRTIIPAAVAVRVPSGPSAAVKGATASTQGRAAVEFRDARGSAVTEYSGVTPGRSARGLTARPAECGIEARG